jgi:allantoinase
LQFALPVLWTAARKKNCSIVDIAKWLSGNSSKLPGMQNAKGKIQKGFDADFVIWNPEKKFVVTENSIHHKHKITPYLNEELYGMVEQIYLKGEKVFDNGEFLKLNQGQIILH